MKNEKRILLIILVILGSCGFAQLGVPLSQYSGNSLAYNPAYAGLDSDLSANLSVRRQWVQLPDAPSLLSFNVHAPFENPNHAWGVVFQRETWAALSGNFGYLNYAYNLFFHEESLISFGLQAGIYNHALDWSRIEHIVHPEDPIVKEGRTQQTKLDVNFGAYYLTSSYYVGFSVKHLSPPKFSFGKELENETWYPHMGTQFFLTGGMLIQLEDEYWSLRPELLLRYVSHTRPTVNVGLLAGFQGRYFFGMNYQTGQHTVSFSVRGLHVSGLRFGYSYDMHLGAIRTAQSGSHEISAGYMFNNLIRKSGQKKFN
jgi:type IX secretion system PorP/SprF family membrane protein